MFLLPRGTALKTQRSRLSSSTSYLGHPEFLHTSCWLSTPSSSRACANLHGPYCRDRKTCVIVGKVCAEKTSLHPWGNYDGGETGTTLEDAVHTINLECPVGVEGFEDDFPIALDNMCKLANIVPGANNAVDGPQPKTKLLFQSRIFKTKPLKKPYHEGSMRHDLKFYPMPSQWMPQLKNIMKTHQLNDVEFWKEEMRIFPEEVHRTLVGQVVVMTFYLSYTPDGLECQIRCIEIL